MSFDSITAIQSAEHPYTTCNFQVMGESMHKWLIGQIAMRVRSHTHQSYFAYRLTQKMDIFNRGEVI